MKYLSVCSGIEAATSAWHHMGWEPVAFSEIEPFPSAVLQHHYPNVPNWGDMTKYQTWPDATINLLVGGTPCQSFSVAGLRQGLKDPRGNLMLTFLGIADRYRPKYIVWENVPGVLSSNGGKDFGAFLGALGELGYGWAYRVLDAQWFGVAQRRRRVFVVGVLGDQRRAAEILFESESVRRDTPPSRKAGKETAGGAVSSTSVGSVHDVAETLIATDHKGPGHNRDHNFITQPIISPTVTTCKGSRGGSSEEAIEEIIAIHNAQHIAQPVAFRDPCPTLTARMQGSSGWAPTNEDAHLVGMEQPIAFAKTHKPMSSTDPEGWSSAEVSPTITHWPRDRSDGKTDVAVAFDAYNFDTNEKVCASVSTDIHHNRNMAAVSMQVRRLTPVECERLQGFPDNHTNIPWRGKAEAPDGPRYKALGNSMAVPVMRWIGERINSAGACQ